MTLNVTRHLVEFLIDQLREKANDYPQVSDENDTLTDAADALADAADMLTELGEL